MSKSSVQIASDAPRKIKQGLTNEVDCGIIQTMNQVPMVEGT